MSTKSTDIKKVINTNNTEDVNDLKYTDMKNIEDVNDSQYTKELCDIKMQSTMAENACDIQMQMQNSKVVKLRNVKQLSNQTIVNWGDLVALNFVELAHKYPEIDAEKKTELLSRLLEQKIANQEEVIVEGLLDFMPDGYAFVKFEQFNYLSSGEDVYVANQLIKKYQLRPGDRIRGSLRVLRSSDKYFGLTSIELINNIKAEKTLNRPKFEKLTPIYPNKRIVLESKRPKDQLVLRMIDIVAPIGFGQRCLIVAPPKAGKTEMLQAIAHAITDNHPDAILFVLLIDERPEEVTEMQRCVKGEVISSTFDEQASRHVQIAEMLLERAKRLVEQGKDVVILLDALTRLARAYNTTCPSSGKVLTGGVEANALHKPKRFFGAARNIEEGGSLTIVATALIETNSKMDEVIFEEFKGTGNSEIQLHRALAERGIFPAININSSGTRKDELILDEEGKSKRTMVRNVIASTATVDATTLILKRLQVTANNQEFFRTLSK